MNQVNIKLDFSALLVAMELKDSNPGTATKMFYYVISKCPRNGLYTEGYISTCNSLKPAEFVA